MGPKRATASQSDLDLTDKIVLAINNGFQDFNEQFQNTTGAVIQTLSNIVKTHQTQLKEVTESQSALSDQLSKHEEENNYLKYRLSSYESRIERLERTVDMLNEEILDLKTRSMKDNIVIYKLEESENEKPNEVKDKVAKFIKDNLHVDDAITIDRAHRLGAKKAGKSRSIVAKIASSDEKSKLFQAARNLKDTNYSISDQYPPEIDERRKRLVPIMKAKKEEDENVKCRLVGDRLYINGERYVDDDQEMKMVFTDEDVTAAKDVTVYHSEPKIEQGSTFQGHASVIKSQNDVKPVLLKIFENKLVAGATHNIYAYRIKVGNRIKEGCCDDKEYGAGRQLLSMLQDKKAENAMIVTTRWFGGKELGPDRYMYIKEVAAKAFDELKL